MCGSTLHEGSTAQAEVRRGRPARVVERLLPVIGVSEREKVALCCGSLSVRAAA